MDYFQKRESDNLKMGPWRGKKLRELSEKEKQKARSEASRRKSKFEILMALNKMASLKPF